MARKNHKTRSRRAQSRCAHLAQGALIAMALILPAKAAFAEALVVGSNLPAIKVGTVLSNAQAIEVKSGQTLRLMLPSGRTKVVRGPAKADVAALTKNLTRNEKVWNTVLAALKGRSGSDSSRIGAVRGMAVPPTSATARRPYATDEVVIDAASGGTVCVAAGKPIRLMRTRSNSPTVYTLLQVTTGKKAVVKFAEGETAASWPADIKLENGGYAVLAPGTPMRQIQIKQLAENLQAEQTVSVLAEAGCQAQLQAYLAPGTSR